MRIDNRFFNRTIFIAGFVSILFIAWFSLDLTRDRITTFQEAHLNKTEWNENFIHLIGSEDSTRFKNIKKPAVIYFWAGWSEMSIKGLDVLISALPDTIPIYAALVKDSESALDLVSEKTSQKVTFVHGTYWYFNEKVPAVPTILFFEKDGRLSHVDVGIKNESEWATMFANWINPH